MVDPKYANKYEEDEKEFWRKIESGELQLYSEEHWKQEAIRIEEEKEKKYAHPDAMGKTEAKILLILGMVGSLIFVFWPWLWIALLSWYFGKDRV